MTPISTTRGRSLRQPPPLSFVLALAIPLPTLFAGCGDADTPAADARDGGMTDATFPVVDLDAESADARDAGELPDGDAAQPEPDGAVPEGDPDSARDAAAVASAPVMEVYVGSKALSPDQSDRLVATSFGPDGKIYAAGYITEAVPNSALLDRKLAVARFNLDGSTDTSFGVAGVASLNVVVATTESDTAETAKGVAVQSDGKVIVVGTALTSKSTLTANYTDPSSQALTPVTGTVNEVDLVVARFTQDGVLDSGASGFGVGGADGRDGVLLFSLSSAVVTAVASSATPPVLSLSVGNDDVGGVAVDSQDRVVVFARAKAPGARTDFDRFVVRLTPDGAFDVGFANNGQYVYSSEGAYNENARSGSVLPDDGIVSAGYTNIAGKNTLVIARVDADGRPLAGFGNYAGGLVINPFRNETTPADSGFCEAYAAAVQSDGRIVTTGYGKVLPSSAQNALLSVRIGVDGTLDSAFGNGGYYTVLDTLNGASNPDFGPEQGRNAVALPDDRILMVGNGTPESGPKGGDGLVVVLSKDGAFDTTFSDRGHKTYDLGLSADQLWGAALSPDGKHVAVVGYSAATTAAPASESVAAENSALIIYKISD